MKEELQQLNHLSEVLYNESRNLYTVSKGKAQLYQDIIDEIQEQIDIIMNEIACVPNQVPKQPKPQTT